MPFINKIKNLKYNKLKFTYIIILLSFCQQFIPNNIYNYYLSFDIHQIFSNYQIWRLVSFILSPYKLDWILFILQIYIYFFIISILEEDIGFKKIFFYYSLGIIIHILIAIIFFAVYKSNLKITYDQMIFFFFIIYAFEYPDNIVLFLFIIPLKLRYLQIINFIYLIFVIFNGIVHLITINSVIFNMINVKDDVLNLAISSFVVILLYFIYASKNNKFDKSVKKIIFKVNFNDELKKEKPRHICEVCGKTDISHPDMEFRYCSKCKGLHEYCIDHIKHHKHIR